MTTYATGLEAVDGGETLALDSRVFRTPAGGFTEVAYDLERARAELDRDAVAARTGGLWRFRELLPIADGANVVSLGEGATPLLPSRSIGRELGLEALWFKDLTRNPTGSFKDYSASVSVSKARELGVEAMVLVSAGNASSAFAAYCTVAGIRFVALMMPGCYPSLITQNLAYGAEGWMVEGDTARAGELADRLTRKHGWMNGAVPANPYRVEGKKVIGYEIAEALGWQAPDRIVCPTAGGTSILALSKAFAELGALGWAPGVPKLDCVQAQSCQPVVGAWRTGSREIVTAQHPDSIAIGLLAAAPAAGPRLLDIMAATGGHGEAVGDDEIRDAQRALARGEGLYVEPSSAAALAGLRRMVAAGVVRRDERIVLMLTGSGLKSSEVNAQGLPPLRTVAHTADDLD